MNLRAISLPLPLWLICAGAIALVVVKGLLAMPAVPDAMMLGDNDDLMRLVAVRDWLAGQGWFDTRQYRLLPPDGVPMHWSRYVDAGIAAFLVPGAWVLPMPQAEQLALTLWPVFLACLAILVIGPATDRLFGRAAAVGALVMFLTWSKFGGEFRPGRIDHHNVQLLCGTAVFFLSVLPGRPRLRGALAGGVTALSFAVGLEMLPFLALVWGMAALRNAFDLPQAREWLISFGLALLVAAPLAMAGQVPASDWLVRHCDVLAPPLLLLIGIGVAATLFPLPLWGRLRSPALRIGVMLAVALLGLALTWPVLGTCLTGPYAMVSPEAREIIDTHIREARPALDLFGSESVTVMMILLSPVLVALLACLAAWRMWPRLSAVQRLALIQGFVVALAGLAFAMTQIRAANLMVPAMPLLAGFLVRAFIEIPAGHRLRGAAAILLLAAMPMSVAALIGQGQKLLTVKGTTGGGTADAIPIASCRKPEAMAELAALGDRALVFTSLNLGAAVLAYTPASATSAPYHRSADAFWNGIGAFESLDAMEKALARSGAGYLALCPGMAEGKVAELLESAQGSALPAWLEPLPGPAGHFIIFRVREGAAGTGGGGT